MTATTISERRSLDTNRRCYRCQQFKRPDGILLCPRCASTGSLRQDATVFAQCITITVTMGGHPAKPPPPQPPVRSIVKATVDRGSGRRRLTAKQERAVWNNDRQAHETRTMVIDRADNYYLQEWCDPDTGGTTFRKQGQLDDPSMHGRASHRPTSPRR